MLKDIKKNKLFWIAIAAVVVILIAVLVGVLVSRDSKESGNPGANFATGSDKDDTEADSDQDKEGDEGKPYDGSGLEVAEDGETPMESIDVSGSWDGTADGDSGSSNTTDNQDGTGNEDSDGSDETGVSDGDTLEGGSWTKPR